jgi:ribosomal protein L11 methyltransferase
VIIIEPGMAFGTGTHATTRGCMEFIEKVAPTLRARSLRALDVGTGSGILAIALAKSGAKRVWALDNDPVALKVARENLRLNGVHKQVRLVGSKLNQIKTKFPVVVANITAETILELVSALRNKVAPGGFLILSGILNPRANDVVRRFTLAGFCVAACKREKEWATLLLRRARP